MFWSTTTYLRPEGIFEPATPNPELIPLHEEVREKIETLKKASTTSAGGAANTFIEYGDRHCMHASPNDEGWLRLHNEHWFSENIDTQKAQYERTLAKISLFGYLGPSDYEQFESAFGVRSCGIAAESNTTMQFPEYESRHHIYEAVREGLGLETDKSDYLHTVAIEADESEKQRREPNWLVYSRPLISIARVRDVITASIGQDKIRKTRLPDGYDHCTFQGVSTSPRLALELVKSSLGKYLRQVEAAKVAVQDVPTSEFLEQQIRSRQAENIQAFAEQTRRAAPELMTLTEEDFATCIKLAIKRDKAVEADLPPLTKHALRVIRNQDAGFRVVCSEDDKPLPGLHSGSIWKPVSYLYANGRTRLVTRIDYNSCPDYFVTEGKRLRSKDFDSDKSVALRQQMFEVAVGDVS